VSTTVNKVPHVLLLPEASVTVTVIGYAPPDKGSAAGFW